MVLHGGVPDKSAFATQAPPYSGVQQSPGSQPGTAGLQATCTQASSLMDVCLRHFLGCALLWAPLLACGAPLPCGPLFLQGAAHCSGDAEAAPTWPSSVKCLHQVPYRTGRL